MVFDFGWGIMKHEHEISVQETRALCAFCIHPLILTSLSVMMPDWGLTLSVHVS